MVDNSRTPECDGAGGVSPKSLPAGPAQASDTPASFRWSTPVKKPCYKNVFKSLVICCEGPLTLIRHADAVACMLLSCCCFRSIQTKARHPHAHDWLVLGCSKGYHINQDPNHIYTSHAVCIAQQSQRTLQSTLFSTHQHIRCSTSVSLLLFTITRTSCCTTTQSVQPPPLMNSGNTNFTPSSPRSSLSKL